MVSRDRLDVAGAEQGLLVRIVLVIDVLYDWHLRLLSSVDNEVGNIFVFFECVRRYVVRLLSVG